MADVSASEPRLIGGAISWESAGVVVHRSVPVALRGVAGVTGTVRGPIMLFDNMDEGRTEQSARLWVVADLDLTNERELRTLIGCTADPCELVAALYAKEGSRFVRRLRGAFALGLWDEENQELLLAVDHFGVKRLYYTSDQRSFAFANRASALPTLSGTGARVDLTVVYNYLNFGFVPAPASVFHGVSRLGPGHLLRARAGQSRLEPYWDMRYPEGAVRRQEGAAAMYRLTEEAVGRVLEDASPKEVGAFLSGGTDSSTIVGLMGRLTEQSVNAFSIGFAEHAYDELDYARLAARHFDAAHHTTIVTPEAAFALLPRLVDAYDEPFGNNSAIGTFFCADLARELGVGLLLAGDGGDEIFGGNERYRTDRIFGLYSDLPHGLRRGLIEPVLLNLPDRGDSVLGRAQRYIRRANLPNPRRLYSYEFFFALEAARLFTSDFLAAVDLEAPHRVAQAAYDRVQATSELNRLLYLDLKLAIGDNDLLKVTRTAELAGVKVRFPLLDLDLVEFTGTLPARLKVRGLEKRHLFKRAFRQLLPREILAKRKHGFGVPTSGWLRDHAQFRELARETLLSTRARERGYFRAGAIEELLDCHQSDATPYYGDLIWRILMLELWHCRHLDGVPA
jgi:asparagine synthase (glutamine-hydrolysing)